MPVQARASEEALAEMPMAALRPWPHTGDAFPRTPGPHGVAQECLPTPIGPLPRRPHALTQPLGDPDQWTSTPAGVPLPLSSLVVHVPPARASLSHPRFGDGRGQRVPPPIPVAQRPLLPQLALNVAPTGA